MGHEEDEYKKAQAIRDADIATINKAMAAIDELIAVEKKHVAGPTTSLLQVPAESQAAIKKVRDMITAMLSDVEQEEKMQKMILDMMKAKYDQALAAHTAAAEQERRTINAVREMLTKIQSAEADVL